MVVDMGIALNLPFPAALRPERGIELFLVFDWSTRRSDSDHPFRVSFTIDIFYYTVLCLVTCINNLFLKEILSAEKWALSHNVPFPNISRQVQEYEVLFIKFVNDCYSATGN